MSKLRIIYKKSMIGNRQEQKQTLYALGLRKLNQVAVHPDNPAIRGMVFKVRHLVTVEEMSNDEFVEQA